MAAFRVTQMHKRLVSCLIDSAAGAVGLLKGCLCLRCYGGQRLKRGNRQARDKLRVTKPLVVTAIPKKLSSVLQEEAKVFVADFCLLGETGPVSITGFVEGDDKIVDRLRLRGDLP